MPKLRHPGSHKARQQARADIESSGGDRVIATGSRARLTIEELLAGMTPDREHPLEDGTPTGDEII